ncbi:Uncharacterized protein FKW44_000153 [Caligus rogercresseyi]|uniref:RNA-directed DNA polymerase n=1 Tax=Caligus rogercresseyi TaxID=217165 RepID=A0A7T8KGW6_CALRO|nr:Uncharacterized protein FKW44_000153 [Caligus rogercresseyi]
MAQSQDLLRKEALLSQDDDDIASQQYTTPPSSIIGMDLSSANRSAAALRSSSEKKVQKLSTVCLNLSECDIDTIINAEVEVCHSEQVLEKLKASVDIIHSIKELGADECLEEKYFVQYELLFEQYQDLRGMVAATRAKYDHKYRLKIEEDRQRALLSAQIAATPHPTNPVRNSLPKFISTLKPSELENDADITTFKNWKIQFEDYFHGNRMDLRVLDTIRHLLEIGDDATVNEVLTSLHYHYEHSLNVMTRRLRFQQCVRRSDEKFTDYLIRLRLLGDSAELDRMPYEEVLASHIIVNINDSLLQKELLKMDGHGFQEVKAKCMAWEASERNHQVMYKTSTGSGMMVNKMSSYKSSKRGGSRDRSNSKARTIVAKTEDGEMKQVCPFCGGKYHPRRECPASYGVCNDCGKKGHFAKACRKKSNARKDETRLTKTSCVKVCVTKKHCGRSTPLAKVQISLEGNNWTEVTTLPDTGTAECLANDGLMDNLGYEVDPTKKRRIIAANGTELECVGAVEVFFRFQGYETQTTVYVSPDVTDFLLAWHTMQDLRMISPEFPFEAGSQVYQVKYNYTTRARTQGSKAVQHVKLIIDPSPNEVEKAVKAIKENFKSVFNSSSSLKAMQGEPMHIHLQDIPAEKKPKPCCVARSIPYAYREAAKKEIDDMVEKKIIKPVSEPTDFVSPFLVVPKSNGSIRLVVDYKGLNKFVKRPIHPFPSVTDVKQMIPSSAKWFAVIDATKGYWQVPLDEESQLLTTFLTPWGRFCYTRAPMGLSSSGDEYCARGDQALSHVINKIKVVDDILIYADTWEELMQTLQEVLHTCKKNLITLSPAKLQISKSVHFVGMVISKDGVKADPTKVEAISKFPAPTNITDLRSFFGLVNQLGNFVPDLAHKSTPLRPLLSSKNSWNWTPLQQEAFEEVKKILVSPPVLAHFDPSLPTRILTDASRLNGLGYALMQNHSSEEEHWKLIQCGSRYLTDTETRYSVGELEALAIQWGINCCRTYLLGLPHFFVVTDHLPLRTIANNTNLASIDNARMQRILEKVNSYNFTVVWTKGKTHLIADALSRSPVSDPTNSEDNSDIVCQMIISKDSISEDPALGVIREAAKQDEAYQALYQALPKMSALDVKKLPEENVVKPYLKHWNLLSITSDGLIVYDGHRLIIPQTARPAILKKLHASHLGVGKTRARARELFFWHGMGNEIAQMVESCEECQRYRPQQQQEPLQSDPPASRPFESVSADLFEYRGRHFLVIVDRYSGWPIVHHHDKVPKAAQVIKVFKTIIRDHGIPNKIRSDGGRQFASREFQDFCQDYDIVSVVSSAHYPQSNGHAEAAVKAMKLLVKKNWRNGHLDSDAFDRSLIEWRNTPRLDNGLSPAQWLYGRLLRTGLPAHAEVYKRLSNEELKRAEEERRKSRAKTTDQYNTHSKVLPPLYVGQEVRLRNPISGEWTRQGIVAKTRINGRSYEVTSEGSTLVRNRRHLRVNGLAT